MYLYINSLQGFVEIGWAVQGKLLKMKLPR